MTDLDELFQQINSLQDENQDLKEKLELIDSLTCKGSIDFYFSASDLADKVQGVLNYGE